MAEKKSRGGPRKYPSKYTWEVTENGLEVVEVRKSQFGDYRKFKSTKKGITYGQSINTPLFDSIEEANKNRPEVMETKLRQKKKSGGPRKYPSKYGYIVNSDNKLELKELRFFEASGQRKSGYRVSEFYPSGQIKLGKMYQGQSFDSVNEAENNFKKPKSVDDGFPPDQIEGEGPMESDTNRRFGQDAPTETDFRNDLIDEELRNIVSNELDDGFKDPNKDFDAYMLETTDEDIAQWYFEKTGKDWVSDTKTMSENNLNRLKNDFKTDIAQDMVANFNDDLALSAREWLNENTTRGVDPTAQMDDTLAALEQSNADMFPEEVDVNFDEDAFQNYRNKIESLEDLPEDKYKEIVTNLSGDEIANLSEEDITKIYNEAGLKYDSEYGGVRELDTSAKPRGTKILKALDWLDPVEKAIAGMISSIGLPAAAKAYVTAEAVNWFGNLTFEAAKSKGQADLLQSQILMGQATKDDINKFTETVMSNMQSGIERADKISLNANAYSWIGKMLNR